MRSTGSRPFVGLADSVAAMLWVISLAALALVLFYAFNAYIQFQERGFAEALDVPIAVFCIVVGALTAWRARATRRAR